MAQTLAEQVVIIERALGERMMESALLIVRSWMNELGENNPYEEAHTTITNRYNELFTLWLTSDEEELNEQLNRLTGDLYQLVDAVYADIRVKRGVSPDMHGYNPDSAHSVLNYFSHCVRFRDEDLEWYHKTLNSEENTTLALLITASLARNMRECFSMDILLAMIDGINSPSSTVADQCIANVLFLLVQYDIRIDFFPQVQEAFINALSESGNSGEHVFEVLCGLLLAMKHPQQTTGETDKATSEMLPSELQKMIKESGLDNDSMSVIQWMPGSESDYIIGLLQLLPQTWLYEVLVAGEEARESSFIRVGIKAGFHDFMWIRPELAEKVYRTILRRGSKQPIHYINYAHCLLLKGDRMMAFENYKQARSMCKHVKDFYALFRPDRGELVDRGVPLEHVYLIEDKLFNP